LPVTQEPYATALKMAWRVDGVPRRMMPVRTISHTPVEDRMPLFMSAKGLPTTQYAMDDVEELGLLKMDLLGQAGLSVLRDAVENVRANRGVEVRVADVDWEDAETWEAVATGNARGVFHIESR
jgi:DNA polymerase-3 subunit alpha